MTTPYVTGTVSVTAGSAIVTGAGTGWQTAGLVAGVFGLDSANGNPIPVLSVDSDTQITLAKPWRGATASGQAYWITYDTTAGQQTVSLMQKVVEYIARLDKPALAALAALTPAADKLPYFGAGGAGALADFPAAARALLAGTGVLPNSQLPGTMTGKVFSSLSYLAGFENTGSFRNISNGTALAMQRNNVDAMDIEAFSASNGSIKHALDFNRYGGAVRIGGRNVYERGSNANGEYVRFGDGTQICWRKINLSQSYGYRCWANWSFPALFVDGGIVGVSHSANINDVNDAGNDVNTQSSLYVPSVSDISASAALLHITCPSALANWQTIRTHATAIGRWF